MKNILWVSRHQMTETQEADLRRIAADEINVYQYKDTVRDVNVLVPLINNSDIICAVLPIGAMSQVRAMCGDKPLLQARSARLPTGNVTTLPDGRQEQEFEFKHVCWEQILKLEYEIKVL